MNNLLDNVHSIIGPMIVPLPLSNKYYSSIILSDCSYIHNIQFSKQNEVINMDFMSMSSIEIHKYILDLVLKAPESIVIYNDINKIDLNDFSLYQLKVAIVEGNKRFDYVYTTEKLIDFLKYLDEYSNVLKTNNFDGLHKEVDRINNINGITKSYKIKTSRKSLIK